MLPKDTAIRFSFNMMEYKFGLEDCVERCHRVTSYLNIVHSSSHLKMFQFVNKKNKGSSREREDPENMKLIRSHAMKDVRRRQRAGNNEEGNRGGFIRLFCI